jgi:hypothetical protein
MSDVSSKNSDVFGKTLEISPKMSEIFLNSPIVWVRYAPAIIFQGAKSILMSFVKKSLLLFFEKKKIEILTDMTETLGIYAQMCWDIQ